MKKLNINQLLLLASLTLVVITTGCATVADVGTGGKPPTRFESMPSGATVTKDGQFLGVTPFSASLSPRVRTIDFEANLPGYQPAHAEDIAKMDALGGSTFLAGNGLLTAIFGVVGIGGFAVDAVTKDYRSHGDKVFFVMTPIPAYTVTSTSYVQPNMLQLPKAAPQQSLSQAPPVQTPPPVTQPQPRVIVTTTPDHECHSITSDEGNHHDFPRIEN